MLTQQTPSPWWALLFQRQQTMGAFSRPAHVLKPARLSLVLAVVLGLLLATTVVYAASGGSVLNEMLQQFQQAHQYPQTQTYTNQSLSRSIDGYTLTLSKTYADSTRVIIGYSITAPKGVDDTTVMNKFAPNYAKLTTQQGISLPPTDGLEQTAMGISGLVMNFDASAIQQSSGQLVLQLKMPYGSQAQNGPYKIQGWLSYAWTVPFHPGRVANVQQTQTSQGLALKVDHVIVAPSATVICLQGLSQDFWYLSATVAVGQMKNVPTDSYALSTSCGQGMWNITMYDTDLFSQQGSWTLTIVPKQIKAPGAHPLPASLTGTRWTFQFTVPAGAA